VGAPWDTFLSWHETLNSSFSLSSSSSSAAACGVRLSGDASYKHNRLPFTSLNPRIGLKCSLHPTQGSCVFFDATTGHMRCKTRNPAVARIADRTGCQLSSRLFNVDDFQIIWKPICHFLLVISSNLGRISHRFWDMTSFLLKKNARLPYYTPFNPQFKNVLLALDRGNFACPSLIPRLHDQANVQQTPSKLPANVGLFKIHVLIARRSLEVCWKFAALCYNGRASLMFAGHLLDRVNGV